MGLFQDAAENMVAPLVGAWIEISEQVANGTAVASLLSWERGLKFLSYFILLEINCRSSRGSVD